jgi:hypothetical protein
VVFSYIYPQNNPGIHPKTNIMSRNLCHLVIFSLSLLISVSSSAQGDVIKQQACDVRNYQQSIDSLKLAFETMGYSVLRETSISMESEYEMPIILPMTEGSLYQFVFIGDPTSKLYEIRMYDWNEKQVMYKKNMWGDVDGNIISYSYIPKFTEYHMIKAVQVNKNKKKLCGYVMLLKKNAPPTPGQDN